MNIKKWSSLITALFLLCSTTASSSSIEDGIEVYRQGNYDEISHPLAAQGLANAQNNLGWMYEQKKGVTRGYKEAVKWYRLAAEQGYAAAQNNLGVMYVTGKGMPQDSIRTYKLFNLPQAGEIQILRKI